MLDRLTNLNAKFSIADHLAFRWHENGLVILHVDSKLAMAEICLQGAQVTAFTPKNLSDNMQSEPNSVLWMSPLAHYENGKAIRGGVPLVWPWFGSHASDPSKPQHGFARTLEWQVDATSVLGDGSVQVRLKLTDNADSYGLWPHSFELGVTITVGARLKIELTSHNIDTQPVTINSALHSYFSVGDVRNVRIEGLSDCDYIDQLDNDRRKRQVGDVRIEEEVDRIYCDTESTCVIHDPKLLRKIQVEKSGSRSTVIWNPWQEKAKTMSDFPDEAYREMVCIETANARNDARVLAPGEQHTISQLISISAL